MGGAVVNGRFTESGSVCLHVATLGFFIENRLVINNLDTPTKILIKNEWF